MTMRAWPSVIKPKHITGPELRNAARGGSESINATTQWIFNDAGFWELVYSECPINNRAQTLAWRSLTAWIRSGDSILVKVFDKYAAQYSPGYSIVLTAPAVSRATSVSVSITKAVLEPGVFFNSGNYLHQVTEVTLVDFDSIWERIQNDLPWSNTAIWLNEPIDGTATYTISFLPPLRTALSSGALLTVDNLVMESTVVDMRDGDLEKSYGMFGSPSITFREYQ